MANLRAKVSKKTDDYINLKIKREDLESFCSSVGLFKKEFIKTLEASERDHKYGRVRERSSLYELIKGKK